jgi:hypothetical protein
MQHCNRKRPVLYPPSFSLSLSLSLSLSKILLPPPPQQVPEGVFYTGTLELLSHTTLQLMSPNTTILGKPGEFQTAIPNPYSAWQDWGHSHWHDALIVADNVVNVTVTGPGQLDGGAGMTSGTAPAPGNATKLLAFKSCTGTGWHCRLRRNTEGHGREWVAHCRYRFRSDPRWVGHCWLQQCFDREVFEHGGWGLVLKSDWSLGMVRFASAVKYPRSSVCCKTCSFPSLVCFCLVFDRPQKTRANSLLRICLPVKTASLRRCNRFCFSSLNIAPHVFDNLFGYTHICACVRACVCACV